MVHWNLLVIFESALWTAAAVVTALLIREVNRRQRWPHSASSVAEGFA